ncbi:diguanylate cyclase [uncultured Xylophilus sp.]|uniref:GGDEF domain-containing protein n=1 Tax=uncultured Xylophilus sp. TaxID=296832 RepID=UPI0025EC38EF|nr:diguanylate cyclase [uncultured Xylophilus sp.]
MQMPYDLDPVWSGLSQAWDDVGTQPADIAHWAVLMLHCDRLGTLAEEHGLPDVLAALAPLLLRLEAVSTPDERDVAEVEQLWLALEAAVQQASLQARAFQRPAGHRRKGELPLIVVIGGHDAAARDALLHMEHYGYRMAQYTDPREGAAAAVRGGAVAAVVDIGDGFDSGTAETVATLQRRGIPWCAMAGHGSYALRLEAVRHGALFYFVAPLSIDAIAEVVDPVAFPADEEPFRVLLLDDSRTVLASVRTAMAAYPDVRLGILSQPEKVLDVLQFFTPDVLLLDMHLDGCSGLEVAKIIRQHKAFESVPIVYMTSDRSEAAQQAAMRQGGDDFLVKPVPTVQLYEAITQRARRYRGLRRLMEQDSLTGLYNHGKTKALLQQSLAQAERQGVPLTYALIDIDHFKRINDSYGHGTGDKVIMTLARHLRRRVRATDIVGRYGGEEFALVLLDCGPDQALALVESIRDSFARVFHTCDEGIFTASFSGGIACYPQCPDTASLMSQADEALYAAKRAGRNRVQARDASA